MASNSNISLKSAADAVNGALARLEAAAEIAAAERAQSAQAREDTQAKLTANWQTKYSTLEAELAQFKEENQRLSNQLQQLSQEHVALQATASSTVSRLNASVSQLDLLLEQTA